MHTHTFDVQTGTVFPWEEGEPETETFTVHHNSDYSGDARFRLPEARVEHTVFKDDKYVEVKIPFDLLKEVVAAYVRDKEIARLEQADADEILLFVKED